MCWHLWRLKQRQNENEIRDERKGGKTGELKETYIPNNHQRRLLFEQSPWLRLSGALWSRAWSKVVSFRPWLGAPTLLLFRFLVKVEIFETAFGWFWFCEKRLVETTSYSRMYGTTSITFDLRLDYEKCSKICLLEGARILPK